MYELDARIEGLRMLAHLSLAVEDRAPLDKVNNGVGLGLGAPLAAPLGAPRPYLV